MATEAEILSALRAIQNDGKHAATKNNVAAWAAVAVVIALTVFGYAANHASLPGHAAVVERVASVRADIRLIREDQSRILEYLQQWNTPLR